jgi:Mrp family chromosome partitioning ATPase
MPPETGDILLDSIRYLRGDRGVLLVTAPTILSINVLKRLVEIICDMKIDILGLIINNLMNIEIGKSIQEMLNKIRERYRIPYISETPYDPEASIAVDNGDINRLMDTIFKNRLENIILDIIKQIEQ